MKKILLGFLIVILGFVGSATVWAASSQVESHRQIGSLHRIRIAWTAHTDGTYTSYTIKRPINGTVYVVETDPGTTAPTADYTVALTTVTGIDIMGGVMADCSATATERWKPYLSSASVYDSAPVIDRLILSIADNSVNSATGTIDIYYYAD